MIWNPLKWKLHWQILAALILSGIFGVLWKKDTIILGIQVVAACEFIGTLFLNALKMIVVPLIVSTIVSGMIGLGSEKNFGRMGLKTLVYYMSTGLIAILIGLILVNVVQPGNVDLNTAQRMKDLAKDTDTKSILSEAKGRTGADIAPIFERMIPSNVIEAATENENLLGVIFFSLLFGFFITRLPEKTRKFQVGFWESAMEVMMKMADLIIAFAPIGVFALVTPKLITFGFDLLEAVSKFFITVLLGLGIHFLVALPLILLVIGRVNPLKHYRAMASALLMAFSTASSVSTLPVTLECVEENAGVSNRVASFTLPLGATVNMDGTALYECVVVIFIAQFYTVVDPNFQMTFATQFSVVVMALLTSVGVAGIPSASLVAIAVILGAVGLPLEYIGIVLVVDRVLDMCRTAINVFSDSVGAVVIGRTEGESGYYRNQQGIINLSRETPQVDRDGSSRSS